MSRGISLGLDKFICHLEFQSPGKGETHRTNVPMPPGRLAGKLVDESIKFFEVIVLEVMEIPEA